MIQAQLTAGGSLPESGGDKQLLIAIPEIRRMQKIISAISFINLLIGLPSLMLLVNVRSLSLTATGLLSLLTFGMLRMAARYMGQSKSWAEVGMLAMCGVYFPAFIIWICGANLIEAIVY